MIKYSIIIVNYKTPQLVANCLQTIFQPGVQVNMEVIVVDNFSQDNSEKIITSQFPEIRWIQMDYNSGFARANNAAMKVASGEVFLLLNSDTLNEADAINKCYERFVDSIYVACGVQLLNCDRSPQISGNYFMKGALNHLMVLPYTGRIIRWLGLVLKVKKTNVPQAEGVVEVDWINGAFLMVKKSTIEKAGLMDEDFFLYSEEIEWCSRLQKVGKICIYGDLHVVHLQGASANEAFDSAGQGYTNLSDRKGLQIMLSGFVRIRKQYGTGWFLFHLLTYLFTSPVYFIIAVIRTLFFRPRRMEEWKSWWGFTKNVCRVCSHFFTITRNKPHFYKAL